MAQVLHFGYGFFGPYETGMPPGAQHSWSFGPDARFAQSGLVVTAHPELDFITGQGGDRRLTVTMIQSHRTPTPSNAHFVHVLVRNVGSAWVNKYGLWLTLIVP
jgi:hypothetical protein